MVQRRCGSHMSETKDQRRASATRKEQRREGGGNSFIRHRASGVLNFQLSECMDVRVTFGRVVGWDCASQCSRGWRMRPRQAQPLRDARGGVQAGGGGKGAAGRESASPGSISIPSRTATESRRASGSQLYTETERGQPIPARSVPSKTRLARSRSPAGKGGVLKRLTRARTSSPRTGACATAMRGATQTRKDASEWRMPIRKTPKSDALAPSRRQAAIRQRGENTRLTPAPLVGRAAKPEPCRRGIARLSHKVARARDAAAKGQALFPSLAATRASSARARERPPATRPTLAPTRRRQPDVREGAKAQARVKHLVQTAVHLRGPPPGGPARAKLERDRRRGATTPPSELPSPSKAGEHGAPARRATRGPAATPSPRPPDWPMAKGRAQHTESVQVRAARCGSPSGEARLRCAAVACRPAEHEPKPRQPATSAHALRTSSPVRGLVWGAPVQERGDELRRMSARGSGPLVRCTAAAAMRTKNPLTAISRAPCTHAASAFAHVCPPHAKPRYK